MSVFRHALGDRFDDLHPTVQDRYGIRPGDDATRVAHGRMRRVDSGSHVRPLLWLSAQLDLLFPETGRDVPFSVYTRAFEDAKGRPGLTISRAFDLGPGRRFDATFRWDAEHGRLLDFLGRGGHFVSALDVDVLDGGLQVTAGAQWLRTGDRYLRLPDALAASVEVLDRYDEVAERYAVDVTVTNPLAGHVFGYRGWFEQRGADDEQSGTAGETVLVDVGVDAPELPPES